MAEKDEPRLADEKGSDILFDFYCEFCSEDGKMLEAEGYCVDCKEYLCGTCYTHHRNSRERRRHVLFDKDKMPKDTPLSIDRVNKDISKMCDLHPGEPVKYYCKSHDYLGCNTCFIEGHRNCSNIENISKVSETLIESQEFKDFINMLKQFDQNSRGYIQLVKDNMVKSQSWYVEVEKSLQKFKEEIVLILDELETNIKIQAANLQKEEEKKLTKVSYNISTCLESVEKISGEFDHLQKSSKVCEIYIKLKEWKKEATEIQTKLTEAERENTTSEYVFDPNTELKDCLRGQHGLGKLSVKGSVSSDAMARPHSNPANTKATRVTDIDVKPRKDEQNCWITGSAVVSNNRLIIVDCSNSKVKLIDTQSNKVISELTVSGRPWDVAVIGRNQAAVTLWNSSKVLLLSVSDTLTPLDREITVGGMCNGVAYSRDRLVVTYTYPGKLEIMDLYGKVMKTVKNDRDGNVLLRDPYYVCVSNDGETIYVSDLSEHKVFCLNFDGEVKHVYSDSELKQPHKVCVDKDNNVFVCCLYSKNVHMLTANLNKIKIILTQADELYSVSNCQETNRLYVGMNNNKVKVYQLSQ